MKDIEIEYILQNFDFHKVHKVMEVLQWEWSGASSDTGIPTIDDLRNEAKRLLEGIGKNKHTYLSCGGFVAQENKLTFELESYQIYA